VITADPSRAVTRLRSRSWIAASAATAAAADTAISFRAGMPKWYAAKAAAGMRAATTDHITFGTDSPERIWGAPVMTGSFCLLSVFSFSAMSPPFSG